MRIIRTFREIKEFIGEYDWKKRRKSLTTKHFLSISGKEWSNLSKKTQKRSFPKEISFI